MYNTPFAASGNAETHFTIFQLSLETRRYRANKYMCLGNNMSDLPFDMKIIGLIWGLHNIFQSLLQMNVDKLWILYDDGFGVNPFQ